ISDNRGCEAPLCTGISLSKKRLSFKALAVVFSMPTLPLTVEIIFKSNSGWFIAKLIAAASSMPGSVSIIIGCFIIYLILLLQKITLSIIFYFFCGKKCYKVNYRLKA